MNQKITEKIKEKIEQDVLVALNLFAMLVQNGGYTSEGLTGFTNRIVEDVMGNFSEVFEEGKKAGGKELNRQITLLLGDDFDRKWLADELKEEYKTE